MNFIKQHWFGGLVGVVTVFFVLLIILVAISPKYDAQNRGFVYCTGELIEQINDCERTLFCSTKAIVKSTVCDISIVAQGFSRWLAGRQPYPWSNYLFTPEPPVLSLDNPDVQSWEEYSANHPDDVVELEKLKQLRKDLDYVETSIEQDLSRQLPQ
ncbi:MAG: hypothetical protein IJ529_01320 [Alphaproteobacteria bacterium]|nr:hypothetical protein [Alphaproteobacteria bacterium]MBQ9234934.1 hypothetical protein [Alphaproteobacteria bacterium]